MFESLLFVVFIFWLIYRIAVWIFDALLGILPHHVALNIRKWVRFTIALLIVLAVLSTI